MERILRKLPLGVLVLDSSGRVVLASDFLRERGLITQDPEGKRYYEALKNLEIIALADDLLEGKKVERTVSVGDRTYRVKTFPGDRYMLVEDTSKEVLVDRAFKEFVGAVSHELATPITAVKGMLETALSSENPDRSVLERAVRRIEDLERIVRAVRTLLMVETPPGEEEEIELGEVLECVLEDLKEAVAKKGLKVSKELERVRIKGSRERVYILFRNILENAVKFNREGGSIKIKALSEEGGTLILVEDTGEGIPREKMPYLFKPFLKGEGGLGLGLTISRKIVESMGGSIEIRSERGKSTTVKLTLPAQISNL
ncbi:MAG: HAMP domain-containing sensor histidine kinase [Aquificota bacterium]|nr:HAMP domain-containing sensor histidine kinase [Aquificota bacterium]